MEGIISKETKILIAIIAAIVVGMIGLFVITNNVSTDQPKTSDTATLVKDDSHKLSTASDKKVTIVEFLDFECEACGANYADVERIVAEYKDKITYVVRYFPISSHKNAQLAAQSVEAASKQGKFAEMYRKMYDNQTQWAEQQTAQTVIFAKYASEIGLNMEQFNKDVADAATIARVKKDSTDGEALGVNSTPTFFFNGEQLQGMQKYDVLKQKIDAALK